MSSTDKDLHCRLLLAKAVVGRGHKFSQMTHTILPSHTPSTILGCWIINSHFTAEKVGDSVEISGTCDVNLWYSFADNTQTEVKNQTVKFRVDVPLSFYDKNARGDLEVRCECTEQPKCVKAEISGGTVTVKVEQEYAVEVVGETKVCVVVCNSCDHDKDHFHDSFDDEDDDFDEFDSTSLLDDLD